MMGDQQRADAFCQHVAARTFGAPGTADTMACPTDSMEPAIFLGDTIAVDTRTSSIDADGVYALRFCGAFVLRRVHALPRGLLHLTCDNAMYPAEVLSRDQFDAVVTVLGAVTLIERGARGADADLRSPKLGESMVRTCSVDTAGEKQ